MTDEQLQPSALEIQNPRIPAAEFLYQVFDESKAILRSERRASTVAKFESQFIDRWNGNVFNMVKGLILRSENYDYGLTMGVWGFGKNPDYRLMMEFGKLYHLDQSLNETLKRWGSKMKEMTAEELKLNYLDIIVHQPGFPPQGSGRFYVDSGEIGVDCWVDRRVFGGRGIGGQQSIAGLGDYVNIIREFTQRAR